MPQAPDSLPEIEEFDPSRAVTLVDKKLENHDVKYDDDRLVVWSRQQRKFAAEAFSWEWVEQPELAGSPTAED